MPAGWRRKRSRSVVSFASTMLALATRQAPILSRLLNWMGLSGGYGRYPLHFRSRLGGRSFLCDGADSWAGVRPGEWQRLLTLANLIVVTRPGFEVSNRQVTAETTAAVVDVRGFQTASDVPMLESGKQKILLTDAVMLDVSATEVRQAAREGQAEKLNSLVPLEVADYIRKYRLYRNSHEA